MEIDRIVREEPCTPWLRDGFPLLSNWVISGHRNC
jgi:hypothetical protein